MVNVLALNGRKVVTSDAFVIGEVEGAEVDTENWAITHLRVILTKQTVKDLKLEPPILWDVVLSLSVKYIKEFSEPINLNISLTEVANLVKSK